MKDSKQEAVEDAPGGGEELLAWQVELNHDQEVLRRWSAPSQFVEIPMWRCECGELGSELDEDFDRWHHYTPWPGISECPNCYQGRLTAARQGIY